MTPAPLNFLIFGEDERFPSDAASRSVRRVAAIVRRRDGGKTRKRFISVHLLFGAALPALVGSGCAGTDTVQIAADRAAVAREQREQLRVALETSRTRNTRLQAAAWPVLEANTALCGDRVESRTGVAYATRWDYPEEERAVATETFGLSDRVTLTHVTPGSPAEGAGLKVGDVLVSVNGVMVPPVRAERDAKRARRDLGYLWDRSKRAPELIVRVEREGDAFSFGLEAIPACSYPVVLATDTKINAFADGENIIVTTGMLRFVETDLELQTVIGHELAHNIKKHVGKKKRNIFGLGLIGVLADALNAMNGIRTNATQQWMEIGSRVHSQDFEREADYVGLYLLANAGIDTEGTADFWRRMAVESADSILYAKSHPTTAERYVNLNNTTDEIASKRSSGQPLLPNLKR